MIAVPGLRVEPLGLLVRTIRAPVWFIRLRFICRCGSAFGRIRVGRAASPSMEVFRNMRRVAGKKDTAGSWLWTFYRKVEWSYRTRQPIQSGLLTTASNLVFAGQSEGSFDACTRPPDRHLWSHKTPAALTLRPRPTGSMEGNTSSLQPGVASASGCWVSKLLWGTQSLPSLCLRLEISRNSHPGLPWRDLIAPEPADTKLLVDLDLVHWVIGKRKPHLGDTTFGQDARPEADPSSCPRSRPIARNWIFPFMTCPASPPARRVFRTGSPDHPP